MAEHMHEKSPGDDRGACRVPLAVAFQPGGQADVGYSFTELLARMASDRAKELLAEPARA